LVSGLTATGSGPTVADAADRGWAVVFAGVRRARLGGARPDPRGGAAG